MRGGRLIVAGCLLAAGLLPGLAAAQLAPIMAQASDTRQAPASVLVLDTDRLFAETEFGQRLSSDLRTRTEALIEENRRIEAQLTEEEQGLTRRRPSMEPAAFRAEAEAFDTRVQSIRKEQDAKERALQQSVATGRDAFLAAAAPTLGQVMLDRGASVILDRRGVFLSIAAVDITDAAVAALDAEVGDGADLLPAVETAPRVTPD